MWGRKEEAGAWRDQVRGGKPHSQLFPALLQTNLGRKNAPSEGRQENYSMSLL